MKKVLIAGESWMSYTTHVKGFDMFTTSVYEEGVEFIQAAIEKAGYEVTYLPNHVAPEKFPLSLEELNEYDCVILSDIGSNTLLLPPATFSKSEKAANRCELLKEYVNEGGAFLMVGGYMSFTGIDAKTRYGKTAVKDILPVKCLESDDRIECPQGVTPEIRANDILKDMPENWPHLLGYNQTEAIDGYDVIATVNGDPLIAVGNFGKGKSAVFTSDCAPHWCPPEFVAWEFYDKLWANILDYIVK